jgi:hypothetical protein
VTQKAFLLDCKIDGYPVCLATSIVLAAIRVQQPPLPDYLHDAALFPEMESHN